MHCPRMEGVGMEGSGGTVEAFVELGTLIVEGRLPAPGTTRGYKEGSHCPAAVANQLADHQCDTNNNFLCKRAEKLRKHMSLLCSNAVPMCVEVLLCPNCECGVERARCPEVANLPSSSDLLLEQWTVYVGNNSNESCGMSVRGLFQAVRSQLHFSQLSAWWSSSKGTVPNNVYYRVTLPGEAFASHFSRPPVEHSFPIAAINSDTILKVSVSTLPRCESMPVVTCPAHTAPKSQSEIESVQNVRKRIVGPEQALLGESLLDPPGRRHSDRIMATPGVSRMNSVWRNGSPPSPPRRRLSRQNMVRLRDNTIQLDKKESLPMNIIPVLVDDRMQTNCDRPGKHHCHCEEESESIAEPQGMPRQRRRSQVTMPLPIATQSSPSESSVNDNKILNFDLSQKEVEEVLTVLRTRSCSTGLQQPTGKLVCNEESCGKLLTTTKGQSPLPSTSVVGFVSEEVKVPGKAELLLSAILRTSRNADEPSPLKRRRGNEDDVHKCDFLRTDLSNNAYDLSQIIYKKISQTHLFEEKTGHKSQCSNSVDVNKPWTYDALESTGIVDSVSRNNQTSSFQTKPDDEKSHKSAVFSLLQRFRTKHCVDNKQEENICSGSVKCDDVELDTDLLNGIGNLDLNKSTEAGQSRGVPTALDKAKFRRSLDSAASMVFHWRTGLPLTSSPAPVRRASHHFDFDSSITSVSAIRSALYDSVDSLCGSSEDTESEGSAKSPCSPQLGLHQDSVIWPIHYHPTSSSLLGSFEESVLNGRLEPVSTVQGFTADLGASGSFCPRHLALPVTVFFYTLGDNDKVSTPYLGHINLGKKGYVVPRSGTIQVTLLNPLGTVIKMFVVMYDLSDMPVNSHTFLRQRTLYMPANTEVPESNAQKYLRYLIHLRFCSSKSGRISLHTDIRMIIFRKSDFDTATGHGMDSAYEMRSFTTGPTNPKFSPRK